MQVKDRMTPNPVTVAADSSFENALHLMKEKKIRRLPIVTREGRLVGIVVQKDLFSASPSKATSLSVFATISVSSRDPSSRPPPNSPSCMLPPTRSFPGQC